MFSIKTLRECECEELAKVQEKWSDAARAASAAGRKRAGKGLGSRKQAAHGAYNKAISNPFTRQRAATMFQKSYDKGLKRQNTTRLAKRPSSRPLAKRLGAKHRMVSRMSKGAAGDVTKYRR